MSYIYGCGYLDQMKDNNEQLNMGAFEDFLEAHWWHYQEKINNLSRKLNLAAQALDSDAMMRISQMIGIYGAYVDIIEAILSEYRTNGIQYDSKGSIFIEDYLERMLEL